jgi:hypothetical protein
MDWRDNPPMVEAAYRGLFVAFPCNGQTNRNACLFKIAHSGRKLLRPFNRYSRRYMAQEWAVAGRHAGQLSHKFYSSFNCRPL